MKTVNEIIVRNDMIDLEIARCQEVYAKFMETKSCEDKKALKVALSANSGAIRQNLIAKQELVSELGDEAIRLPRLLEELRAQFGDKIQTNEALRKWYNSEVGNYVRGSEERTARIWERIDYINSTIESNIG